MNDNVLDQLQWLSLIKKLYVYHRQYFLPEDIEMDKRKRPKVIRDAIASDLIVPIEHEKYVLGQAAFDKIPNEEVNLLHEWRSQKDTNKKNIPYISVGGLYVREVRLPVLKAMLSMNVEYYILDRYAFGYYKEVDETTLFGPYTLVNIGEGWDELYSIPNREFIVVVSTPELREQVLELMTKESVDYHMPTNLAWGLAQLNILSVQESEVFKSVGFCDLSFLTTDSPKPEKWGEMTASGIKDAHETILRCQKRIEILTKMNENIQAMGGWELFINQMSEKLYNEIKKNFS